MFQIGQKVVRVKDDAARNSRMCLGNLKWPDIVHEGRVLTIRDIDMRYVLWYGVAGLRFEELFFPAKRTTGGPIEPAFPADQFRHVQDLKSDIGFAHEILRAATKREPVTT